jgi:hypothetical protein
MSSNHSNQVFLFLEDTDPLAIEINEKANLLWKKLQSFDTSGLEVGQFFKDYFIRHHLGHRLFFSIQNSAHIIYRSVKLTNRPVRDITMIDYGAGLGTLFMLGGMMKFKAFFYNDHLPEWKDAAAAVCDQLDIKLSGFIAGNIENVTEYAEKNGITLDIIASRNVIEHIYSLPAYFSSIHKHNPKAIVFSTTTANYHNPAMRLYHYLIHRKMEQKYYANQRKEAILNMLPSTTPADLHKLVQITRGRAFDDFTSAVYLFIHKGTIHKVPFLRSNTCNHTNGVWAEHLLTKNNYASIISAVGFNMEYTAGFWVTHYRYTLLNLMAKGVNKLIPILGKQGIVLSPCVNIIACPAGPVK